MIRGPRPAKPLILLGLLVIIGVPPLALAQETARPTKPRDVPGVSWKAEGKHGAIAAGGAEAVAAGMEIMQAGGNAVDGGVATLLAQTVTDASSYCFGGEVPILIYNPRRRVIEVIAGQGAAPRLATREHFNATGGIPKKGIEAATVPATLDACLVALERHGTMSFAQVAAPGLRLLDRGEHPWHADLARTWRLLINAENQSPHDRSRGLRLVADAFYRGPIARAIDSWARSQGALLRFEDLATHVTRVEEPVTALYRGFTVAKCGVWTQGPALLQTLRLLEGSELKSGDSPAPTADVVHLSIEALKLALADRDWYYADPLFTQVPLDALLSDAYTKLRRPLIDLRHASREWRPGDAIKSQALLTSASLPTNPRTSARDTTTCLSADGQGFVLAATPSGWSGVLAGDTGVWLGSRLQSFNLWPEHPNVIEPGKRPRITLTPTLVLNDQGEPILAISVAGGDLQDQVVLQMVVNTIDLKLSPEQAVTAPRFSTDHHVNSFGQSPPLLGSLKVQRQLGEATIADLKARGHDVSVTNGAIAAPVLIRIERTGGPISINAAGDPRAGRHAAAY